jgi:hypothetical protein
LSIIASNNEDTIDLLWGISIENRGEATLGLSHLDLGVVEPNLAIEDLDAVHTAALRVLTAHYQNLGAVLGGALLSF